MSKVLVLQSFRDHVVTSWVTRCRSSVTEWCALHGYTYTYCGDELFARLPAWYLDKVAERLPIAADLARLLWIAEVLESGEADIAVWLDADVFIMAPQLFTVEPRSSCIFGYEYWLQKREGKAGHKVHKNVHNAYCAFRKGSPVLPFLIDAIQRMVQRVDADYLAPQFVGPKLLTSLHNIVGFETDSAVGAISPDLKRALLTDDRKLIGQVAWPKPLSAANLCTSLNSEQDDEMHKLLDVLAGAKSGLT